MRFGLPTDLHRGGVTDKVANMIMTDGTHLVSSESLDELHTFARTIGLRRGWFQDHRIPHYDLFGWRMLQKAQAAGAIWATRRQLVLFAYDRNGVAGIERHPPGAGERAVRPQLQADMAGEGE